MLFKELAAVTGGELQSAAKAEAPFTGVAIDSRVVNPGELFIAIRGEKNDGHEFIDQAIDRGAAGVVLEASHPNIEAYSDRVAVVRVIDSHQAMLRLAKKYRDALKARFVGITGSNGKTTTKELTCQLIGAVDDGAYCSPGNLNNLFGVPLAIFAIGAHVSVAVLELGISTREEMPKLADMVQPDLILITNVGPSHLQFLDTVEDVARAKLELVKKAGPDTPVIVNGDDEILVRETRAIRTDVITFGLEGKADFVPTAVEKDASGLSVVTIDGHRFSLPLVGRHQVYNLVAAYAIFRTLGFSFEKIDTAQLPLGTAPLRGQRLVRQGITFVADCYNANPDSMKAGLKAFFEIDTTARRIIVLGDMLELGDESSEYHRRMGEFLAGYDFDLGVMVGPQTEYLIDGAVGAGAPADRLYHFGNVSEATATVREKFNAGDLVYIKGSRGVGLEAVLDLYAENEEKN